MSSKLLAQTTKSETDPQLNLTPLIDVVFVILIMFIVIAPLLEVDRIALADAGSYRETSALNASPLTLHVQADNTIWYQKKKISLSQLPFLMQQSKQQYPGVRPQIFLDKNASFGTYQSIKNSLESTGFEEMDIILKPSP